MSSGENGDKHSSCFEKILDAEDYLKTKSKKAAKDMYKPQCDTNDCLKHCADPTLMQACPCCKEGSSMTLD
ncbi:unnamed protein product, partial [Mesorhabditis belari]|uniref:Uncharacterized protein n=1 Tax=Mesorhabditis belari TaxID=2138241 RepID=A0AAF3EZN8_9BILA